MYYVFLSVSFSFFLFLFSVFFFFASLLHTQYGIHAIRRHHHTTTPGLCKCFMCLADITSVLKPLPHGYFARCSSQCYREFKNKKRREPKCIPPFPFPSLKPFPLLSSIICTRTLSNLSAKTKDIHLCMIITHAIAFIYIRCLNQRRNQFFLPKEKSQVAGEC